MGVYRPCILVVCVIAGKAPLASSKNLCQILHVDTVETRKLSDRISNYQRILRCVVSDGKFEIFLIEISIRFRILNSNKEKGPGGTVS